MALAGGELLNATPPSHSQPIPIFSLPTFTFKFLKADQSSPLLMVLFGFSFWPTEVGINRGVLLSSLLTERAPSDYQKIWA